jgi:hypothetical protein
VTREFHRVMKLVGEHIKNGGCVDADIRYNEQCYIVDGTAYDIMTVTLS